MSSSDQKTIKEFPDLTNKLAAPGKKSLFERQRADAEAKRVREEAETAAVYEDFVKSFENDNSDSFTASSNREAPSRVGTSAVQLGPRAPSGPPKRHFAPGSRTSGPGSLGPPPNLSRKRGYDGAGINERDKERRIFTFEDEEPTDPVHALRASDDEHDDRTGDGNDSERTAPKPTLQLSSLPPGTSPAVIKNLIPPSLKVDAVRMISPASPSLANSTERKAMAAIVTLAGDTPASDIDTVVSSLQNTYMGWGYNLYLSRHLSSTALGSLNSNTPALNSGLSSLPFGARALPPGSGPSLSRAPPPDMNHGGFAPPSSYGPSYAGRQAARGPVQVKVNPPPDIKQLKLIHKTVESLLTHGPEFEALLMSRPEVQKEEKWAWIWNSRSPGGVWYRWRLWEILTGVTLRAPRRARFTDKSYRLFEGAPTWSEPEPALPFEFSTQLEEMISDSDYNSSDEEVSGDEAPVRQRRGQMDGRDMSSRDPSAHNSAVEEQTYLNPFQKAKLTHLLARLPTTTAKLRKGDVARVTAFAIAHAGQGAEEVVDMMLDNIVRPFAWSKRANPESKDSDKDGEETIGSTTQRGAQVDPTDKREALKEDTTGSALIALHLISDILSASSTSGVRHAWRYRSLFETSLASRSIFPYLGRMEKMLGWGRLRADKWKRSVNVIMQLWEGWCVFPAGTQERFAEEFAQPPLTEEELQVEEERQRKERENGTFGGGSKDIIKSKWKTVDVNEVVEESAEDIRLKGLEQVNSDVNGEAMEDVDGEPMADIDGEPMEDIDGQPMDDTDDEPGHDQDPVPTGSSKIAVPSSPEGTSHTATEIETFAARAKRQRPKAEDMFADSDDE